MSGLMVITYIVVCALALVAVVFIVAAAWLYTNYPRGD